MKSYGEVVRVEPNRVRPFKGQPREFFDQQELLNLEVSIKQRGQIQPGLVHEIEGDVDHDFELVDGQRRWHACGKLGIKFCAVVIELSDAREQYEISVASNFQRADHTPLEIASAVTKLYEAGRSEAYIGTLFGKSPFWVGNFRRLPRLIPELQKLLDPGQTPNEKERLSVTTAVELCRLEPEEQRETFKRIKTEGLNSTTAAAQIRSQLRDTGRLEGRNQNPSRHADYVAAFLDRTFNHARLAKERISDKVIMASIEESGRAKELRQKVGDALRSLAALEAALEPPKSDGRLRASEKLRDFARDVNS